MAKRVTSLPAPKIFVFAIALTTFDFVPYIRNASKGSHLIADRFANAVASSRRKGNDMPHDNKLL